MIPSRQRTIEEVKTHQPRRPAMSQIDDSVLRLAQRAAYKTTESGKSALLYVFPIRSKQDSPVSSPDRTEETRAISQSPKQHSTRHTRKQSVTYPTDSLSAAASVPRLRLPSLSPFPSHSCSNHRKTKASSGGGRKRSSSQESKRSCGGKGSKRKSKMLKTSGACVRTAC